MFITNDDLKVLIDVEDLLHSKVYDVKDADDEEKDLWNKYWNIIEKLCAQKDKKNKINSARIAEKRKLNKDYARSKKEIENRQKAELKREMKNEK